MVKKHIRQKQKLLRNIASGMLAIPLVSASPIMAWQKQPKGKAYTSVPKVPIKRCVNMGNMFEQSKGKGWGGRLPTEQDFMEIAAVGFDTVRLPVRWSAYAKEKESFTISPSFFKKIDQVIGWANTHKLNIIVNMHHYDELFEAPADHETRFIAMWQQIAARYAGQPESVMFEFINEPHKKLTNDVVEPLLTKTLAEVRKTNPTRKVIMGGDFWSGISSLETFDPPKDKNVIATFHFYEPFQFTHQGASWINPVPPAPAKFGSKDDYAWLDKMTKATVKFQQRTGIPLFMGEFGAIDSADIKERIRYTYAVRKHSEALNIGWCVWAYTNTFHIRRDAGWTMELLAALGLPPKEKNKLENPAKK